MASNSSIELPWMEQRGINWGLLQMLMVVWDIASNLRERNPRSQFICEAIRYFSGADFGPLDTFTKLFRRDNRIEDVSERWYESDQEAITVEQVRKNNDYSIHIIYEIVHSTIYEILDIFEIRLTRDQVPTLLNLDQHVDLLCSLYEQSKQLIPKSTKSSSPNPNITGLPKRYVYRYQTRLVPTKDQYSTTLIRVLNIFPGVGESPIECSLEVRDLDVEGIDEALSYVWGSSQDVSCIFIDDIPFRVTLNLYNILTHLRHCHTTRTIWIDAVCINQSDPEEKTAQVRLMEDIYSKAKKTFIWLSGRTLHRQSDTISQLITSEPTDILAHLPLDFKGNTVDQYDLEGILDEFDQLILGTEIDEKGCALITILIHCVNVMLSHEWWERVWTIQEAALPPEHPRILFQGHDISFLDLLAAVEAINKAEEFLVRKSPECLKVQQGSPPDARFLADAHLHQIRTWRMKCRPPLLQFLRSGQKIGQGIAGPLRRSLQYLLCKTDTYRATDPRDKIFALQSLLPSPLGALICVDYNDSCEDTFKRASARCFNSTLPDRHITAIIKLLIETQPRDGKVSITPSWVQDFTYSDAPFHRVGSGSTANLDGYLFDDAHGQPLYQESMVAPELFFATPKVLFCTGVSIDMVVATGPIPDLSGPGSVEKLAKFIRDSIIYQSPHLREERIAARTREDAGGSSVGLDPSYREIIHLFSLNAAEEPIRKTLELRDELINGRLKAIAGKNYFSTKNGYVGIATCPVEEGDIFGLLHMSPVYYVFRKVAYEGDEPSSVQEHRIVARAVVSKKQDDMKERLRWLESQEFQIV
ncbi:heterokaryon incompatibility protein-domain-containing protein [Annulohypoxylon nitens]|nr:heterokaryon incompatibility protein-domain-containing protein [Annulohypoxylon nitens]